MANEGQSLEGLQDGVEPGCLGILPKGVLLQEQAHGAGAGGRVQCGFLSDRSSTMFLS